MKTTLLLWIAIIGVSCSRNIKQSDISILQKEGFKQVEYIDKVKLKPLKKEWKELYQYLVKNHLMLLKDENSYRPEYRYIVSPKFARFFHRNRVKVYKTPFLQDLDNFKLAFGNIEEAEGESIILFGAIPYTIKDYRMYLSMTELNWTFHKKTRKLMLHGKINDLNQWK